LYDMLERLPIIFCASFSFIQEGVWKYSSDYLVKCFSLKNILK
jgi:hypothetical protein